MNNLIQRLLNLLILGVFIFSFSTVSAVELVIGEERVEPGVILIFEGAVRDHIRPNAQHLAERKTDVHIEARANWDTENIPDGTPPEGFVAYMNISAEIINQHSGETIFVTLLPHVNLIDNLHYARNIALPGHPDDLYIVKFSVNPPDKFSLATHADWRKEVGNRLFQPQRYRYENVNFEEIVNAPPRQ
ncbi:MAG: iron transporter [Pseudomonadota bacterium]